MTQRIFGNTDGTIKKLEALYDYANFYTAALKDKPSPNWRFNLSYVDAFAGAGRFPIFDELPDQDLVGDIDAFVDGSALRALRVDHPFHRYVFSDTKQSNVDDLEKLKGEFPLLADRIHCRKQDANETVREFCVSMGKRDRALIFLDPFGNQVSFETLEIIAATEKIDLWYLFPSWWGVVRQIDADGVVVREAEDSLDRVFGTQSWRDGIRRYRKDPDFFDQGRVVSEKIATVDSVTRFMIERMKKVFGQGVSEKWLPLGRNGRPGYSLLFACANRRDVARSLAHRVANHIMTRN